MTPEELAKIWQWQNTPEGQAEMAFEALMLALDDLDSRAGVRVIRSNRERAEALREKFEQVFA